MNELQIHQKSPLSVEQTAQAWRDLIHISKSLLRDHPDCIIFMPTEDANLAPVLQLAGLIQQAIDCDPFAP